jgi:hypothetical protein
VLIASTAVTALGDQNTLSGVRQVGDCLTRLLVERDGTDWHPQDHVIAGVTRAVRSFAVAPAIRFEFAVIAIAQKRVVVWIRFQIDTAAVAAVAPRRASARHIFLAPERNATIPAVPGLHEYFCFINEQRQPPTATSLNPSDVMQPPQMQIAVRAKTKRRLGTRRTAWSKFEG